MRKKISTLIIPFCLVFTVCFHTAKAGKFDPQLKKMPLSAVCSGDSISPDNILHFAESFIGVRYRYGSTNPLKGFDCSGFVSYVFKNFNFMVPRSAFEFVRVGMKIKLADARPGDIILFTGTKKRSRRVGHMGIVWCNAMDDFQFIHCTSGKEHSVTISSLNEKYKRRFVEIIRLLNPESTAASNP